MRLFLERVHGSFSDDLPEDIVRLRDMAEGILEKEMNTRLCMVFSCLGDVSHYTRYQVRVIRGSLSGERGECYKEVIEGDWRRKVGGTLEETVYDVYGVRFGTWGRGVTRSYEGKKRLVISEGVYTMREECHTDTYSIFRQEVYLGMSILITPLILGGYSSLRLKIILGGRANLAGVRLKAMGISMEKMRLYKEVVTCKRHYYDKVERNFVNFVVTAEGVKSEPVYDLKVLSCDTSNMMGKMWVL